MVGSSSRDAARKLNTLDFSTEAKSMNNLLIRTPLNVVNQLIENFCQVKHYYISSE